MTTKLAVSLLAIGLSLFGCGKSDPGVTDEDGSGGASAGGKGGDKGSGGAGGKASASGGSSAGGASAGGKGGVTGSGGGDEEGGSGGGGKGGVTGSGGAGKDAGTPDTASSGGSPGSGGSPATGGSSGGRKVDWGNDCGPTTLIAGVSGADFCAQYMKACGFGGGDRYGSMADCMTKYMALSDGPMCAKACVAGHLCYASDTGDPKAAPTYCPHVLQASSANGPCKPSYTGCP